MSKIVTSRVVYNINYKNKIEKMKKLSPFSAFSPTSVLVTHQDLGRSRLRREDPETGWGISTELCGLSRCTLFHLMETPLWPSWFHPEQWGLWTGGHHTLLPGTFLVVGPGGAHWQPMAAGASLTLSLFFVSPLKDRFSKVFFKKTNVNWSESHCKVLT